MIVDFAVYFSVQFRRYKCPQLSFNEFAQDKQILAGKHSFRFMSLCVYMQACLCV